MQFCRKIFYLCEFSYHLVQDMTDQMSLLHDNEISAQYDFTYNVESQDDGSNDSSTDCNPQNRILR